jgi:hypothetical protein
MQQRSSIPVEEFRRTIAKKPKGFNGEQALLNQIRLHGLPEPVTQFKFHPVRKWRTDIAYPEHMILIEYDGGTWIKSGHSSGSAILRDNIKHNASALLGYRTLRFVDKQVKSGEAVRVIAEALGIRI